MTMFTSLFLTDIVRNDTSRIFHVISEPTNHKVEDSSYSEIRSVFMSDSDNQPSLDSLSLIFNERLVLLQHKMIINDPFMLEAYKVRNYKMNLHG